MKGGRSGLVLLPQVVRAEGCLPAAGSLRTNASCANAGRLEEMTLSRVQRPACPGGLLGGYGQGWGHRLPPLPVGARAARPVRVVIRTGRNIYRHGRQPGGPLDG